MDFFYTKATFSNLEEFLDKTKSWNLEFRQLEEKKFRGQLIQYGFQTVQVGIGEFGSRLDQRGEPPPDHFTFALLGDKSCRVIWRGKEIKPNVVLVYRPSDEIDCSSEAGFKVTTFSISLQSLQEYCNTMKLYQLIGRFDHQRAFSISYLEKGIILRVIEELNQVVALSNNGSKSEIIRTTLEFRIIHLILQGIAKSVDIGTPRSLTPRSRKALKQIEKECIVSKSPPLSTRDLCEISGLSERTIQYLFQWKYGITPVAYLKKVRLNDVRKILYHAKPGSIKIADIANARGFWHMGQFAKDYRQLFGELPSQTLQQY